MRRLCVLGIFLAVVGRCYSVHPNHSPIEKCIFGILEGAGAKFEGLYYAAGKWDGILPEWIMDFKDVVQKAFMYSPNLYTYKGSNMELQLLEAFERFAANKDGPNWKIHLAGFLHTAGFKESAWALSYMHCPPAIPEDGSVIADLLSNAGVPEHFIEGYVELALWMRRVKYDL